MDAAILEIINGLKSVCITIYSKHPAHFNEIILIGRFENVAATIDDGILFIKDLHNSENETLEVYMDGVACWDIHDNEEGITLFTKIGESIIVSAA